MRKFNTLLFLSILANQLIAQNQNRRISIFANAGYLTINNFDYRPTYSAFGQVGVKCDLFKNTSVSVDINSLLIRKLITPADAVQSYNVQADGVGITAMYEKEVRPDWFLGFGISLNAAKIKGNANYESRFVDLNTDNQGEYLDRTVLNYKYVANIRRVINKKYDIQAGVSFNDFQFHYLDMFYGNNNKIDRFILVHLGLTYKFLKSGYSNSYKSQKGQKLKCPRIFQYKRNK